MSAADVLLERKHDIAKAITDALYAEKPELLTRYGPVGRARCLEDMHYNLEHIAPAVALADATLFARYVVWLRDMLAARNVPPEDVRRSLELTIEVVRRELNPGEAEPVIAVVNAGLTALQA